MSALEPGLYRATVRSVPDQIVMVNDDSNGFTINKIGVCGGHVPSLIEDARPLIVLDLGRSSASCFAQVIREDGYDDLADQIEAQTKPARIPETGLWGVVEATSAPYSNYRTQYVYRGGTADPTVHWARVMDGDLFDWDSLVDPTLIREGLS